MPEKTYKIIDVVGVSDGIDDIAARARRLQGLQPGIEGVAQVLAALPVANRLQVQTCPTTELW